MAAPRRSGKRRPARRDASTARKADAYERALLKAQQEASPDGVLVVDPDGRILTYNRRFVELWGIPAAVMAAKDDDAALASVLDRVSDPEGFLEGVKTIYARPDSVSAGDLHFKDGRVIERLSAPVMGEDGRRYGRVWHFRDVTEARQDARRRAVESAVMGVLALDPPCEEAMLAILRGICQTMGWAVGALWEVDAAAGDLRCYTLWGRGNGTEAFEAASRARRFKPGEGLPGRVWTQDSAVWLENATQDLNFPRAEPARKAGLAGAFAFPVRFGGKVGGVMEFFSKKPSAPDPGLLRASEVVGIQIGHYIERHRASLSLAESEVRLRQMAENIAEAFWLVGMPAGRPQETAIIYISPMWARVFGRPLPPLDRITQVWMDALHPEDKERVLATSAARAREGYEHQYRVVLPDGGVRWIRDRAFPIKDASGSVFRMAGISEDITERRRLEEELRAARDEALASANAKSEFLANVSHELRTPLNAVIGMNELLLESSLDAEQKEHAAVARDAGRGLLVLIDDLLDFARLEAGRIALDPSDFEPRAILGEVERLLRHKAAEKGLAFEVRVDSGVPAQLVGDPARLRQVLINFAGNALKFTEKGRVLIEADCPRRDATSVVLRLRVSDTGIGIAPDVLPRLFQPFTQADAGTTRRFGGTGLGLVISRHIAEAMGGEVGVESAPGKGSVFRFEAPLPLSSRAAAPARPACREDVRGLRVLLVEDNPVNRRVALDMLRHLGCAVDTAEDGASALDVLGRSGYDVVLMDCAMPGMDGYTAAAELRRREAGGARTPVIALTAGARPADRQRCLEAGMDDHLAKPVGIDELAAALSRWGGPIDDAVLRRASALVGAEAPRWRAAYLQDAARLARELTAADAAGDREARARAAHTLKGASAALGAKRLAELCARLEAGAPLDTAALETELSRVRARLEA